MNTNFFKTSHQSKVCIKTYGCPKWWESQFWEFRDSQLGSLKKNDILVQPPWLVIENIIKGKAVASLKSKMW